MSDKTPMELLDRISNDCFRNYGECVSCNGDGDLGDHSPICPFEDLRTSIAAMQARIAELESQAGNPKQFEGYSEAPSIHGYCTKCGANNKPTKP